MDQMMQRQSQLHSEYIGVQEQNVNRRNALKERELNRMLSSEDQRSALLDETALLEAGIEGMAVPAKAVVENEMDLAIQKTDHDRKLSVSKRRKRMGVYD